MRFLGAEREARWVGSRPLAGTVNYLKGQEPSRWHTGIHPTRRRRKGSTPGSPSATTAARGSWSMTWSSAEGAYAVRRNMRA
jgi:hypothetical protein